MPQLLKLLRSDMVGLGEWRKLIGLRRHCGTRHLIFICTSLSRRSGGEGGGREVDCSAEDMVTCDQWIQHAMSVSRFVGDEGTLEKMVCSPARKIDWCSFKMGIITYFCRRLGCFVLL